MHTDNIASPGSDAIINSAISHNVPVISAKQMLTWLDARNSSAFNSFVWNNNTLNFSISAAAEANNLEAMLPMDKGASRLSGITFNGSAVSSRIEAIKGIQYAFFPAASGSYVATYTDAGVPCTPPTATLAATPADCAGNSVALKLSAAGGVGPYSVVVNGQTYSNVIAGQNFATVPAGQSIWGTSGSPQSASLNDGQTIEVGVKFRSSQSGTVTGIRFYKGTSNTGTHTGNLWTSGGTKLASALFINETAIGWQEVRFTTPVAITANTTYVASYFSSGGGYATTNNFFTSTGVTNGILTALQSGVSGANGVYKYGATGFPNQSFNSSNYWVDVLFQLTSYTFTLSSITDSKGCINTGSISTVTLTQSDLQSGSQTFYRDADNDGYGNAAIAIRACTAPAGYVAQAGDCNDSDAAVRPGAVEVCDGKDNNCDGRIDEGCAVSTEQSVWANTGTPANANDYDGQTIEVGVKFRSSQSGTVTGIRFYKGSGNTGTHTGNLWTSAGTKLASALFINETASGWQEVRFTTPVAITANTTYVASYFSSSGRYAFTGAFFTTTGVTNGALTALRAGVDGANGVYKYGATGFPNQSFNSSNYWVDVLFKATVATTSITAAKVVLSEQPLEQKLSVQALPNPTMSYFTLLTKGSSKSSIELRVIDALGRVVESKKGLTANGSVQIGQGYRPGAYFVQAVQGNEKVMVKLVKLSQ
jgi:hypothetical protein